MGDTQAGASWQDACRLTADWVWESLASSYGPHGATKLVDAPEPTWLESGASVLRELPGTNPTLDPYKRLVAALQKYAGDGATTATLLCARLVHHGIAQGNIPQTLAGYTLAKRQARAVIQSIAAQSARPLEAVAEAAWAAPVLSGLQALGTHIDLEAIDVVAADQSVPDWRQGIQLPSQPRARGPVRVLVARGAPKRKPTTDATYRLRSPRDLAQEEAAPIRAWVEACRKLGVGMFVCGAALGDAKSDFEAAGITVWDDAPRGALERICRTTGAEPLLDGQAPTPSALGTGTITRTGQQTWLDGAHGAWTLRVPGVGVARTAAIEAGERLLRAAGVWLEDPRSVPGDGAWQKAVARSLRAGQAMLPGRQGLAWHAAAESFEDLERTLRINAGQDPLDVYAPTDVEDVAGVVLLAVDAAFDAAIQILRIDALHTKSPSNATALRGGDGPIGSPKNMPGDIPPLM